VRLKDQLGRELRGRSAAAVDQPVPKPNRTRSMSFPPLVGKFFARQLPRVKAQPIYCVIPHRGFAQGAINRIDRCEAGASRSE